MVRPTGAAAPIGPVLFHHTYIGPVLVIPPRLFRGRDHLFTILPQHFLCHVPTAPATLLLKTVSFATSTIHNVRDHRHNSSPGSPRNGSASAEDDDADDDADQRGP